MGSGIFQHSTRPVKSWLRSMYARTRKRRRTWPAHFRSSSQPAVRVDLSLQFPFKRGKYVVRQVGYLCMHSIESTRASQLGHITLVFSCARCVPSNVILSTQFSAWLLTHSLLFLRSVRPRLSERASERASNDRQLTSVRPSGRPASSNYRQCLSAGKAWPGVTIRLTDRGRGAPEIE